MAISDEEFDKQFNEATERYQQRLRNEPHVVKARYDAKRKNVILELSNRAWFGFHPEYAQGLQGATTAQLSKIQITPSKFGIDLPLLDQQFDVTALLQGHFGSRKWMAARLGAAGGASRSKAKVAAAQANGKLGGRPRRSSSVTA
jgi:hypothetical protein